MYYSAIVLHQDAHPLIDFAILKNTQLFPFRSNTCSNPRRNLQYLFQIKKHKSKQSTNICDQTYKPVGNLRKQLIQKTNHLLQNKKKNITTKKVQQYKKNKNQKAFSVGKMTHSYFFGIDKRNKSLSHFCSTYPQTPIKDEFTMSVHKLNPQVNKSKLDKRQESRRKSVQNIVISIRNKNTQSNIFSIDSNNKTFEKEQTNFNDKNLSPKNNQKNTNFRAVPTVMNLRNRRRANIEGRSKNLYPHVDMSKQDLKHIASQKFQSQQIKRPNTTASLYRKNSGGWQGEDPLAPW